MLNSESELLARIRLGEDSELELKRVEIVGGKVIGPRRDELADELSAMANTHSGVLVLGVDDKTRNVSGVPIADLDVVESLVREVCNDSIKPPLTVTIRRTELPDLTGVRRAVIRVDVPRSLFVHRSPGGYFHRIGSSKREMTPEQLARLFQQRSQARVVGFDEMAVPGTRREDLVDALWTRFFPGLPTDADLALRKMRLVVDDEDGPPRLSVAGTLMATPHPEHWLPQAVIQAVCYGGTKPDSSYQLDAREIVGPLDAQVWEAIAFVRRNMKVGATKDLGRRDVPQYSLRAMFEALVNAVAHRDYSLHGARIRLFMFEDRLELYVPGSLANTLTIDSLPLRQYTRNELIVSLLARCPTHDPGDLGRSHMMDRRGEGVPIILDESVALSGRAPTYDLLDDAELRLTLWPASPSGA